MAILLDTNILIPVFEDDVGSLPRDIQRIISSTNDAIFASVASLWEIAIKKRIGKLSLRPGLSELPGLLNDMGLGLLTINHNHVLADLNPEPRTRDPFDRLLLAQCEVEGLRLVTRDSALAKHRLAWRAP